jgi:hypothetical protein
MTRLAGELDAIVSQIKQSPTEEVIQVEINGGTF